MILNCSAICLYFSQSLGSTPQTYKGPELPKIESYRSNGNTVDGEKIFRRVFSSGESTLTDRFPEDARPWSDWFQKRLRNGKQILNPLEVLRLREIIALFVYHDTRLAMPRKWTGVDFLIAIDAVLQDAMIAAKIDAPSNELVQIGMLEAVVQWVRTKKTYRLVGEDVDGWSNLRTKLLNNFNERFVCDDASKLSFLLLQGWERYRKQNGKSTGLIALGIDGWATWAKAGHAWFGVSIKCEMGRRMKIQADSVPGIPRNPSKREALPRIGSLSRVGCELMAASNLAISLQYDNYLIENGSNAYRRAWESARTQQDGPQIHDPFVAEEERFDFGTPLRFVPHSSTMDWSKYYQDINQVHKDARQWHEEYTAPLKSGHRELEKIFQSFPY